MKRCKRNDCDDSVLARGLCRKHYMEERMNNNPIKCKEENCNDFVKAKGLCGRHYNQQYKNGCILKTRWDDNNITIEDNIAYMDVYNRKGEIIKKAILDPEDIPKVKNIRWKYNDKGNLYNSKKAITLGEVILEKCKKGYIIAHKNNDLLDYRKENLIITKSNRRNNTFSHNTSGRKGVYVLNENGKFTGYFLAYITFNKKTKYLGKRKNFNEAVKLREDAEKELGWIE